LVASSPDIKNGNANFSSGNKHLWIKKATGLGISEFMLRFMAWLCLKDNALSGSQMCIVTGPRIDLAIALIDRMKKLFADISKRFTTTIFDTKETVIELNNVKIEAFPSHHLYAMRGLPNVSFILLDEADFFPPGQQQDARDVSERYIAKSNLLLQTQLSYLQFLLLRVQYMESLVPLLLC
jgi:late competence protein required for DNA uptake (superfamily II DNA/RNA helicase)